MARGCGPHLCLDARLLVLADVAEFQHRVDEETQPEFGREASGRGMRREDQAGMLQIRHHVPDRGRRQRHREDPSEIPGAHRLAGREIALDDLPEDLAGALIEGGEGLHGLAVGKVGTGVCHAVIL